MIEKFDPISFRNQYKIELSDWKPRTITDKTITEDQNKYVHDLVELYKNNGRNNLAPTSWSFHESWPIESDLISFMHLEKVQDQHNQSIIQHRK